MSKPSTKGRYTLEDWLAQPEDAYLELVDGELIQKASPSTDHGVAQVYLVAPLVAAYGRRVAEPSAPGGWWFGSEIDIRLGDDVFRPDVLGWRRDRHATLPKGRPSLAVPDWICEVVSESNWKHDTIVKFDHYHRAGVGHYWLLDPGRCTLTAYRHTPDGYLVAVMADATKTVRAEPFGAIELRVAELFGLDPDQP